jgi:hypothetical protein
MVFALGLFGLLLGVATLHNLMKPVGNNENSVRTSNKPAADL